jgi:hypothetical protein
MHTQTLKCDPLLYNFEMPLQSVYHPLGFSVEITTNSPDILAAAEESWGRFRKVSSEPPLQLRIGVLDGGPAECPASPVCREQRGLLARVADAENFSVSDVKHGFSFAWLTRAAVDDRAYLRWHFIEGMCWDLLELYLTPIHAGCVRLGGHGVLLCGDSGAGKSSLSFACALKGWTYLTDDGTCLVRGCQDRVVVGNPYQIRFRESAVELFPELKNQRPTVRATGEIAIELHTASLPEIRTATECPVDYIVFLNRECGGPTRLLPFPKATALEWFEQVIFCGEKETVDAHKASLRRLLGAEIFELRYGDLDSAVARLEAMVRSGS